MSFQSFFSKIKNLISRFLLNLRLFDVQVPSFCDYSSLLICFEVYLFFPHLRQEMKRHGFEPRAGKIHWRKKCLPNPVFLPGEFRGQRSLVSPIQGVTKSQTWTHTHTHKEVGNYSLSEFEKHWLPRWNHCLGKMKQVCGQVGRSEAAVRKRLSLCLNTARQ